MSGKWMLLVACFSVACSTQPNELSVRIADNLMWVINPVQDDLEGFNQARKIGLCASQIAETQWSADRIEAFDLELLKHAESMSQSIARTDRITVESIKKGITPQRSKLLEAELDEFADFIEDCEKKVGGRGVELV